MIRLLRLGWDRLSLYLPMILMGLLALGTYWLVRSTPSAPETSAGQPVRPDPDYVMERFYIKTFDPQGKLKSEIYGDEARHYPRTDILEIDHVRIRSYNARGYLTTATAKRALTNSDASEVQLIGDAVVVRDAITEPSGKVLPRISFRGEFLHAFLRDERIKSHKPVTLQRGDDVITADSMDFSNFDQVMELRGRVRGTLQSPGTR